MGREFEIKLRGNGPEVLDRILTDAFVLAAAQGAPREIAMKTVYYDTAAAELSARRWTLRLRQENGQSVATVKTPGSGGVRGEWEVNVGEIHAAVPALVASGAPKELSALTAAGVMPRCGAEFTRIALDLRLPEDTLAELAADRGILTGGGRETAFSEVEVELKQGSGEAVVAFCQELKARFGLVTEEKSKFARALALAEEEKHG